MKTRHHRLHLTILGLIFAFHTVADEATTLSIRRSDTRLELSWPATRLQPDGSLTRPYFELQRSTDLTRWQPVGERLRTATATPGERLNTTLGLGEPHAFYRLLAVQPGNIGKLGSGGAEVFGYGDAFAQQLQRIGQISPDEFAAKFPSQANYLPGISWDPATAQFWDQFNTDPEVLNVNKQPGDHGYRYLDSRLNAAELAIFKTNGFVVSERMGGQSFGDLFYKLWFSDLPVFISTDALLQAWHRSYDAMLEEIEETYLFNSFKTMLDAMAGQITKASSQVGNGLLEDSLLDADYFLAVARSLLSGTNNPPVPTLLGQDSRVAETLADIQAEQLKEVDEFMGFCRVVDFSQFKVRGHYTHSERLGRYFKCVMWLGRIDVPVAGGPWKRCPDILRFTSPRETGLAIVLWQLLNESGQFQQWADMERIIETFIGWTDSMTFAQLGGLLAGAGIRTLADVPDLPTLQKIQSDIVSGNLGVQNIRSDWFGQPLGGAASYALPQTFIVFGQKFVPDSWAFSQTVFNSIMWAKNGMTNPVPRRVPGALDVAFSVLGNDQIVPELVSQMKGTFPNANRPHALQFRDGQPYQHNLAAVRAVMDQQTPQAWDSNIYMSWLACLRELSAPTTDTKYPEAMRTRAWAMKTLNTQLASWAQLRHDTILYAKQSYTPGGDCLYPVAFVEPRVEFWSRLKQMAARTADLVARLQYSDSYTYVGEAALLVEPVAGQEIQAGVVGTNEVALELIQSRQVIHLRNFADTVARLETLATKELTQQCFSDDDQQFLNGLLERASAGGASGGRYYRYTGWYPRLFYRTIYWNRLDSTFDLNYGAGANAALVADVHTDVPCGKCGDPGSVLHEGAGQVNLLVIAVDNGIDRFICAGPVLSHYEVEVIGPPRRLSDNEWSGPNGGVIDGIFPPDVPASCIEGLTPPPWTQSYLVPREP